LDLLSQLLKVVDLLLTLLAFPTRLLEDLLGCHVTTQESVDILLFQGKASLDRLLTGPVFAMGLALQEDSVGLHTTIPTETVSLSSLSLLQATLVQLPSVCVIIVDG
jgi:hypothetical protein